ncbi:MAG: hypothetical protein OHK93_005230 [Ramalina farinacea]|uniref:Uncharacterized protein n=1 Tax=Ramalina farinacea TaxID=258253 RepID=A0AA43TVT9_9LECA|nr:hypothetical protein [Ramalina farinacea]
MWENVHPVALATTVVIIVLVILCAPALLVRLVCNLGSICLSLIQSALSVAASGLSTLTSHPTTTRITAFVCGQASNLTPQILSPHAWATQVVHAVRRFFGATERARATFTPIPPRLNLQFPPAIERHPSIASSALNSALLLVPRHRQCNWPVARGRCLRKSKLPGYADDWYCFQHKKKRQTLEKKRQEFNIVAEEMTEWWKRELSEAGEEIGTRQE